MRLRDILGLAALGAIALATDALPQSAPLVVMPYIATGTDYSTAETAFSVPLASFTVTIPNSWYVENDSAQVIGVMYCASAPPSPASCSMSLLQPPGTNGRHDTAGVMPWFVGFVEVQANATGLAVLIRRQ